MLQKQSGQSYDSSLLEGTSPGLRMLMVALLLLAMTQAFVLTIHVPMQYPRNALTTYDSRDEVSAYLADLPSLSPSPRNYASLFDEALPQFDIEPIRVPDFFREEAYKHIYDYVAVYRSTLEAMLARGASHLPLIKFILQQHGLPAYYAYIPLAESAFQADALQPQSGARGLWQLMPHTARAYGLQVSEEIDERLDPIRATVAAALYLRELLNIFGTKAPLLILAAYNFGENNLAKAIMRARTRDVWYLSQKRYLPSQTREYLAKMVAFWVIVTQAEALNLPSSRPPPPRAYAEVTLSHAVPLASLAHQINLSVDMLHVMNPHVLGTQVPAHTPIRIPADRMQRYTRFEVHLTEPLATDQCCAELRLLHSCQYTVVPGDTLSSIAQRHGVDMATIKAVNQLTGSNPILYPGQELTVCKTPSPSVEYVPEAEFG